MDDPPQNSTASYQPEARFDAPTISIGHQLCMFRGVLKSFQHRQYLKFPQEVELFDSISLSWKKLTSVGELPTWFQGASVTTFQDKAYFFGGNCGESGFSNEVFALTPQNLAWKKVMSTDQVLRTASSGLISLPNGQLLTAGGAAECPTHQISAGFIPEPGDIQGRGYTNHVLYTEAGMCA